MKKLFVICAAFLAVVLLASVLPIHGETDIYADTVRLHVKANSDSEYDQAVKLYVRDRVLDAVSVAVVGAKDSDEAAEIIAEMTDEIAVIATEAVLEYGAEQTVSVSFGYEDYPTRYYEDFAMPAGEYRSLIVTLGDGDGQNWWCVLFPRLCSSVCVSDREECLTSGYTEDEYDMLKTNGKIKYRIRFKIVELIERLF